jgi:hypothetical protein
MRQAGGRVAGRLGDQPRPEWGIYLIQKMSTPGQTYPRVVHPSRSKQSTLPVG